MTYISAGTTYDRSEVIVWERGTDGHRYQKRYVAPYYFYVADEEGEYEDIYGVKLTRLEFDDQSTFWQTAKRFKDDGEKVYESDISVEYKVLSAEYFGKIPGKLNTTFFDIEVDYNPARGFSSPTNPYAPINAISIYHRHLECFKVYAVPPKTGKWTLDMIPQDLKDLAEIILCKDEKELLMYILEEFEDSDIISGWNSEGFDVPYIYERLLKVFGKATAARLSFPDAKPPKYKEVKGKFGRMEQVLNIFGRVHIDYLLLMKKFEPRERDSMALEAVSEEELPDLPKLHYEGTLAQLYNNDFVHFLRYNIRDSEVLKGFEDKKGFMALAVILSHMDAGMIPDVIGTIKLTELSMINYCHHTLKKQVHDTNKDFDASRGKFGGAKVLSPMVGLHEMVGSIDAKSLYPSVMRCLNVSPEVLMGQFTGLADDFQHIRKRSDRELTAEMRNGEYLTKTVEEWREFFVEKNYALSAYGTMFDQSKQGIIPALLTSWFAQRKEYQAKAQEATKEYLRLKAAGLPYEEVKAQADYFDKVQNIFKLKLNSTYGACGNEHFKFFDIRLVESTTKTGQEVLYHMARSVGLILEGEYIYPNKSVIYGDTDSVASDSIVRIDGIEDTIENSFERLSKEIGIVVEGTREYLKMSSKYMTPVYNYDDRSIESKPLLTIYRHRTKKKMFRLNLTDGTVLNVTEDHSLLVFRDGEILEIKPSELQSDDKFLKISYTMVGLEAVEEYYSADEYVYDIVMEDPKTPNFFANNILVHNSCYFKTWGDDVEEAFHCSKVISKKINESFPEFSERMFFCKGDAKNILAVAQEIVASKAIFVNAKKGYMLRVLKLDGNDVDKIKITGLALKKTTLPKPIRTAMTKYMERFLKGESWDTVGLDFLKLKESLVKSDDMSLIGLPKNCNNVEEYVSRYNNQEAGLRVPGHVKAVMFWNKCREEYDDKESLGVVSGMKIRVLYLTKKFNEFTNIALPVDLRLIPEWFKEHFMPLVDREKQSTRLVDMPMNSILLAIGHTIPTRKKLMIDDMFD